MRGGFDWEPVEFRVGVKQRGDGATLIEPTQQLIKKKIAGVIRAHTRAAKYQGRRLGANTVK